MDALGGGARIPCTAIRPSTPRSGPGGVHGLSTCKRCMIVCRCCGGGDGAEGSGAVRRGEADIAESILTATTLMANGAAFDDALRLARETPSLDVGCHLVRVGDWALVSGKPFPLTVGQLLAALARSEIRPYEELSAQVRRISGRRHSADPPGHAQAYAPVASGAGCGGVPERDFRHPLGASAVRFSAQRATRHRAAVEAGDERCDGIAAAAISSCAGVARVPDHRPFRRVPDTGRLRTAELVELLACLPEGSAELMCHPGYCGETLRAARTRLKESGERELEALTAPETRTAWSGMGSSWWTMGAGVATHGEFR